MTLPNQFIISTKEYPLRQIDEFQSMKFGDFMIRCTESSLFYSCKLNENYEALLFGEIVKPDQPNLENQEVLKILTEQLYTSDIAGFIEEFLTCSGDYFILIRAKNLTYAFIDACGQFEIFYDLDKKRLTNNPKLLPNPKSVDYEVLDQFKLCIHDFSGIEGVKKLRPNHFLELNHGKVKRYFPTVERPIKEIGFLQGIESIKEVLSGSLLGFSKRQRTVLPITAGYDSRLLLAAYPDSNEEGGRESFIYQHSSLPSDHIDIRIGKQLSIEKGLSHSVYKYNPELSQSQIAMYNELYMPRTELAPRILNGDGLLFSDALVLNGNIGEIGRTYFGINDRATPAQLATMIGQKGNPKVMQLMSAWKNEIDMEHCGKGNLLDLFYWEERMGNWAAKAKTEMRIATRVVSPMNNHQLWTTVLGIDHKYRTTVNNKLFTNLIKSLDKDLLKFPINPGIKNSMMKGMNAIGIYKHYKRIYWKLKAGLWQ